MTSSSPVKAYNATMGTSGESGRLLISAFMYCLESECNGLCKFTLCEEFPMSALKMMPVGKSA